jgi:ParB family chromosome partitioning protein
MPAGSQYGEIPVDAVSPNPRQPRSVFDEEALAELVDSIKEVGLLQPVVVRPTAKDRYELVMGERRLRAVKAAGLATIPAIIRRRRADLLRDALA